MNVPNSKQYVLALDEGTTSARAVLFDRDARIVAMAQHEFPQIYPAPGLVEHDPMAIYANQYAAMTECIAGSGIDPSAIAAMGITNQRETVVVWDRTTGRPVCNAIVWQCRRTAAMCRELEKDAPLIHKITGLRPDPYFSATKLRWILDNIPDARRRAEAGELLFGTVDTWLIWKLTEGRVFVTDRTNASRTMLMNIRTGEWDDDMLALFDIPRAMLPTITSSAEVVGEAAIMGARIPIAGIAGDQQAALFGQCCFESGQAKNTYGTGCFLLTHTGTRPIMSQNDLLTTVAAGEAGAPMEYALEGSVFVGGAVVQWLRDEMHFITESRDSEYFASKVKDNGGVFVVPAFTGLGAPHWDMHARGTILGLTRGTGRDHIIRAALESIAYQTEDVLAAMESDMRHSGEAGASFGSSVTSLRVDGGAAQNDLLMQFQSDISDIPVLRSASTEATAMGAAFLAGLSVGFFSSRDDLRAKRDAPDREATIFTPAMDPSMRASLLSRWAQAVKACRAFGH